MQKYVEKSWGYEIWLENNEKYCGKKLFVRRGNWSSHGNYHYHKVKEETFYVLEGMLALDIASEDGKVEHILLPPFATYHIKPGTKHRFGGFHSDCTFIEFSTTHRDEDSYRCVFSPMAKKWVRCSENGYKDVEDEFDNPFEGIDPDKAFTPPDTDEL